jgi:hypothetical protein
MRYALQLQWANEPGVWQLGAVIESSADAASEFLATMREREAAASRREKRTTATFRIVPVA